MKLASAAKASANLIQPEELSPDSIIPSAFNPLVGKAVAAAAKEAAIRTGVCRKRSTVGAPVAEDHAMAQATA